MRPEVSVIIPTYNRPELLRRAVRSVLNQSFEDFEVIIVDDASPIDIKSIVESFNDNRVKYIRHRTNLGAPVARNNGIKRARGKFIAFLDDDDEWLPERLEVQIYKFEELDNEFGVVYGGFYYISQETGKIIGQRLPRLRGNVYRELLKENFIGSPTLLIRKECFKKAGLFDKKLTSSQDWDMWLRIAKYYKFDYVSKVVAKYYVHGKQISFNMEKYLNGRERFIRKHIDIYKTPKILSIHFSQIGLLYLISGNIEKGVNYVLNSIAISPFNVENYKSILRLAFDSRTCEYIKKILQFNRT